MTQDVMLNLVLNSFQYCFSISIKSMIYETLNQVQGDKWVRFQLPLRQALEETKGSF
jgi:hypothetical protein